MKKGTILIILLILGYLLSSCDLGKENTQMLPQPEHTIEGFSINNEPISIPNTAYSIQELNSFFTRNAFDKETSETGNPTLYLEDINQRFPIHYLRKIAGRESYYIAFPVSEGGKYLIFLNSILDTKTETERLCYIGALDSALYIHDLPTEDAFSVLSNSSTYEDIITIAPCTQLITIKSSSIESYSPLSNGNVMICTYDRQEDYSLVLKSIEAVSNTDVLFPYEGMVPSDLVEN